MLEAIASSVAMVTAVEGVMVVLVVITPLFVMVTVGMATGCDLVATVVMVTGSVLSRKALIVTVCDSAVAAVDSDWWN